MTFSSDVQQVWRWAKASDWKARFRRCFQPKFWGVWVVLLIACVAAVAVSFYHDHIVNFIAGYKARILEWWMSPFIAVLALMIWAIPPMVGHPLLVLVIGLVWGLLKGSIITIVGTVLGELVVYLVIRAAFMERAKEEEASSPFYASVALVLRSGGLWPNTFVRVSFISGHITTILQALTGTPWYIFILAHVFGKHDSASHTFLISALIYAFTMSFSAIAAVILWRRVSSCSTSANTRVFRLPLFMLLEMKIQLLLLAHLATAVSAAWEEDFASPNSWLTSVIDTYPPGLGEPLNVVLSAQSSAEVLTRDGFEEWLNSVGYAEECLGFHAGNKQSADLNDGKGLKEQDGLYRWAYGLVFNGGSCYESLNGGSHVRYWFQERTGAVFVAVSNEMNATMNHDIVPNGYDLGRDMLVGLANVSVGTTSPSSGVVYSTTSTFASGLINPGYEGINHYVARPHRDCHRQHHGRKREPHVSTR
ncbi:hypothetical protein BCR35DRAFT_329920 [Leucosporidium creatinivorum]|uniref:Golgi apparatus membrane protein TVP38 n=1 Tax=Leucosporidium creatinivorum TaxID=106004 RepID=A0A1Y2G192_9BASI|nr:hypothetical protein BCR35DRAFT_329920 [Leucosporidium creatinivorum]